MSARELLVATVAQMTTEQIKEAVATISAAPLTTEARMVRAEMIEEFIRRNGGANVGAAIHHRQDRGRRRGIAR